MNEHLSFLVQQTRFTCATSFSWSVTFNPCFFPNTNLQHYQNALTTVVETHQVNPLPTYNQKGVLPEPQYYGKCLDGAVVIVRSNCPTTLSKRMSMQSIPTAPTLRNSASSFLYWEHGPPHHEKIKCYRMITTLTRSPPPHAIRTTRMKTKKMDQTNSQGQLCVQHTISRKR